MSLLRNAIRDVLRPVVKSTAGVEVRYFSYTESTSSTRLRELVGED